MNTDAVEDVKPLSLVETITHMLREAGHANPESWIEFGNGLKEEAKVSQDINIQRFLINRHWVQIFTSVPFDLVEKTRNARSCLMNGECDLSDYIRLFKEIVVPCAIEMKLLPES